MKTHHMEVLERENNWCFEIILRPDSGGGEFVVEKWVPGDYSNARDLAIRLARQEYPDCTVVEVLTSTEHLTYDK